MSEAPESVVHAVQVEMDCVKTYDPNVRVHYCSEHGNGWLSDRECCPAAERVADAAWAAAYPEALREAADRLDEVYPPDVFIPPSSEHYAEINALLKREYGHYLDGVSADMARLNATVLRRWADESEANRG